GASGAVDDIDDARLYRSLRLDLPGVVLTSPLCDRLILRRPVLEGVEDLGRVVRSGPRLPRILADLYADVPLPRRAGEVVLYPSLRVLARPEEIRSLRVALFLRRALRLEPKYPIGLLELVELELDLPRIPASVVGDGDNVRRRGRMVEAEPSPAAGPV